MLYCVQVSLYREHHIQFKTSNILKNTNNQEFERGKSVGKLTIVSYQEWLKSSEMLSLNIRKKGDFES